jgi:hypothetical protein
VGGKTCWRSVFVAGVATSLLAGCAGNATKPPPAPLRPIARIAVLPVVLEADFDRPARAAWRGGSPVLVPVGPSVGVGDVGAAIVVSGAAALVNIAMRDRASDLERATASLQFHPADSLNAQLVTRLQQAGLHAELIAASDAVKTARTTGDYKAIAAGADAVLDVRVGENGYYRSIRAGGLSPMLGVSANLLSATEEDDLANFTYYSDWREKAKDRRWFTSPPALIFASVDDLNANSAVAKAGLEAVLQEMLDRLVVDVTRRAEGLPEQN